jgi:thioredoxin reductase
MNKQFDVIIIGGSYAGLSAAMALGRSLKKVLVIDSGKPCNRFTPHSHNFITQDGESPSEIARKARNQVSKYDTVDFLEDVAESGTKTEDGFEIQTRSGETFQAHKLIFATGVKDSFPEIEGFEACWGKTIIHCPYCHGYEFKGEITGILANGERAFHLASLVSNLTDSVAIITSGKADFTQEQLSKLTKHNVRIIEKEVKKAIHEDGVLKEIQFKDESTEKFTALYAAIAFEQHSDLPVSLGCELTEMGHIKTDSFQKTSVSGIYACGDNSSMMRSVANAVATGNIAGAVLNNDLTAERF